MTKPGPNGHTEMVKQFEALALDVSAECNLKCAYCSETIGKKRTFPAVDPGALYRGIDFFFSTLLPDDAAAVHFHFGRREPFMNFPLLREVTAYARRKCLELSIEPVFHITTNGTFLSKDILAFLKDIDAVLKISLDAPPAVQNKYRTFADGTGSYPRVMENIEILGSEGIAFTVNSVYHPGISFRELLDFFISRGIERIELLPLWVPASEAAGYFTADDKKRMKREIESYTAGLAAEINRTGGVNTTRIVQVEGYLFYLFGLKSKAYCCGAGRSYIGLSGRGEFYPCLKFIDYLPCRLGDCVSGMDPRAVARYCREVAPLTSELSPCSDCPVKNGCGGLCYFDRMESAAYSQSLDFYCFLQKELYHVADRLYRTFKSTKPGVLVDLAGISTETLEFFPDKEPSRH